MTGKHTHREGGRHTTAKQIRPLKTKARLKQAAIPHATKHARPRKTNITLDAAAFMGSERRSADSLKQSARDSGEIVDKTAQKRTRAEGGRKRRKKPGK